ncbi:MAG TPA: peptidase family C69 [Aeromonadales bacterium]|nr:peptidase family C69 [Aeromonadales bacterium]
MCDTFVLMTPAANWLAKNSDREPDEPQRVEYHQNNSGCNTQQTTYLKVTVPEKKYACWISRPAWMWGAEMGINEHGVAIGNEAVFTKLINRKKSALLGMDLLRLALEQSTTADEALEVISHYLLHYGQGGAAGYKDKKFFYDNSFLIMDSTAGWQLETAGDHWVAKRITEQNGKVAISNNLSIGTDYDRCSDGLLDFMLSNGFWHGKGEFDFKATLGTRFMPWAGRADKRRLCNLAGLDLLDTENVQAFQLADLLRRHLKGAVHSSNGDVCMHATGLLRPSQTTQSMICELSLTQHRLWMTGSTAPCISVFKPMIDPEQNWLLKHKNFWEQWLDIYRATEKDKELKQRLLQLNDATEPALWQADDKEATALLNQWWDKVQQLCL